jgi:heavy metal translocating P-type ATPase
MSAPVAQGPRWRDARLLSFAWLILTGAGLVVGGALTMLHADSSGRVTWIVTGALGVAYSLVSTVQSLRRGRIGVDVIALLALVGALAVREYLAGAVVAVMLTSGGALESWAAGQARRDLQALLERAPRSAHRYRDGALETVTLDVVRPGDLVMVGPGELVPIDGTVSSDSSTLDESALTGESLPVERARGEAVRSGVVNAGGPFDVRATTTAADSTYAGVVRLVAEAERSQAPFVRLADQFALQFLVVTLLVAGVAWALGGAGRAVAVLVVATPCPLILAAPVAFVSGLSRAARRGIVVKGGAVLERLARCTTLLTDKTGTLTEGRPHLVDVVSAGWLDASEILRLAASLDQVSPHVLASAVLRSALHRGLALSLPTDVDEVTGQGVRGQVDGRSVRVGKATWTGVHDAPAWAKSARRRARLDGSLTVFVAVDDRPAGVLIFDDPLRADAARTISSLRQRGITRIVMVSGDRAEVAETVGAVIGVDEILAQRTPAEKLDVVRLESAQAPTMMVGDGINDAPALALASVGVALGARGSTAATEAADVVLTVDRLDRLGEAAVIARRTRRIALESVVVGMALSLVAMGFAAAGLLPAVGGAIAQEFIDAAAILNALRALGGGGRAVTLTAEDTALTERFREEHHLIRADIARIRAVADDLGTIDPAAALIAVRDLHQLLVDEVLPHEDAEGAILYPALERMLGQRDPAATMNRAHVEIKHQIRRLGQLLDDIGTETVDQADIVELRGALYGLHAILKLHTIQEDEHFLSLSDARPAARAGR